MSAAPSPAPSIAEAPLPVIPHAHVLNYISTTSTPTHVRRLAAAAIAWISWGYLLLFLVSAYVTLSGFLAYDWHLHLWSTVESLPAASANSLYTFATYFDPASVLTEAVLIAALLLTRRSASLARRRFARWIFTAALAVLVFILAEFFLLYLPLTSYSSLFDVNELQDYLQNQGLPGAIAAAVFAMLALFLRITVRPIRRGRAWACIAALTALLPTALLALLTATALISHALAQSFFSGPLAPRSLLWILPALPAILLALICLDLFRFLLWIIRNPLTEKNNTTFLPSRT